MGEWYSALGGGVKLNGHEIYQRIRSSSRSTYALGMACSASWDLANRYVQRANQINALIQKLDAAWEGTAACRAAATMRPATKVFEGSHSLLTASKDALEDQVHGYWQAFRAVQYVPPTAPGKDLFDKFNPWSDVDRAIVDYNDKAQRNVAVYNDYHHQSVANGDRMPASYPTFLSANGPSATVTGDSRGSNENHWSHSSGSVVEPAGLTSTGAGDGSEPGVADAGSQPDRIGAVTPQVEGDTATQPQGWSSQGTLTPTGHAGGATADPHTGGSAGWGPGGSAGWGPGGSAGPGNREPDARSGAGPVPPVPGGAAGRLAPGDRGGLPRGGGGRWPEVRTQANSGVLRPVTGSSSAPGWEMLGAQPTRRDIDEDNYRRYGRQFDSDELFDIDVVVPPSVIGAEPADNDDADES